MMMKPRKTHLYLLYFLFIFSSNRAQETTITSTDPSYYYNLCAPSKCNNLTLTYPFTLPSPCHPSPLETTCPNNQSLLLTNPNATDTFRVLPTNFSHTPTTTTFTVASNSLFAPTNTNTPCPPVSKPNYAAVSTLFSLLLDYTPGTHLNCTTPISSSSSNIQGLVRASCLGCPGQDGSNVCYYAPAFVNHPNCETFNIYTPKGVDVSGVKDLRGFLRHGFQIRYFKPMECRGCETSGGRCGASPLSGSFVCFCPSSVHTLNCSDGMFEDTSTWVKVTAGAAAPGGGGGRGGGSGLSKLVVAAISASSSLLVLVLIVLVLIFFIRRRKSKFYLNKERISNISPTRYSYSQIKKFTNNFSTKLGEGGYGCVYKGVIPRKGDEVAVAIKILKKSKQSEKQFMNEVATVGNVHHHHLSCLLGYCAQGNNRALVYEFVEKGSLDNYIYEKKKGEGEGEGEGEDKTNFKWLSPKQMYNIALETARGILYLHQGCRSRILHCDIKPHNVLLDSNFSAKVADFGLAKMINKDQSHVSLSMGRGTPGYAAPEMWLKTLGSITEKSDVYSYGMLILEMVGRRKNYDPNVSDETQVYFPEWVFNKIDRGEMGFLSVEIGIDENEEEDDEELVLERMCLVGLWCIQHVPANRPSMDRVVQMLEGKVEIEIPSNPFPEKTCNTLESSNQDSSVYFSAVSGSGSLEAF